MSRAISSELGTLVRIAMTSVTRPRKRRRLAGCALSGLLSSAGLFLGSSTGCSRSDARTEEKSDEVLPTPVVVGTVQRGSIVAKIRASSTIEAERHVTVHAESTGRIVKLDIEEGDQVRKGKLLARIKYDAQAAGLDRASTSLDKAKTDLETLRALHARGVASREELDTAELAFRQATLDLRDRRRDMRNTHVLAPFDGTITQRFVSEGAFVSTGAQLFSITDFDTLVAVVYVPESELDRIDVGQSAVVTGKASDRRTGGGEVKRIAPIVDSATGTVKVTIGLPGSIVGQGGGFLPGMYAEVELMTEEHPDATLVPKEAVLFDDDEAYVFVVANGRVERRVVELALGDGYRYEIGSGLEVGDDIVIAGHAGLKDGSPIRPVDPLGQPLDDAGAATHEVARRTGAQAGEGV